LNGRTSDAALRAVTRSRSATWVIPTLNEWYKSAYYVGGGTNAGYWMFATQSNTPPSNVLSATGTNNANFFDPSQINVPPNYGTTDPATGVTPVGAFAASPGPYGTYDQGGNVWQWNETPFFGTERGVGGGSFADDVELLLATSDGSAIAPATDVTIGFRVAYVPEPGTAALLLAAGLAISILAMRRRFEKRARIVS